jgi:hypothetical protein
VFLFINSERGMGIFNLASSPSRLKGVTNLLKVCAASLSIGDLWPGALV